MEDKNRVKPLGFDNVSEDEANEERMGRLYNHIRITNS